MHAFDTPATLPYRTHFGATHNDHPVRVIREYVDSTVLIETNEIIDYDDDGDDENGAPIMRPIYGRRTVPRNEITFGGWTVGHADEAKAIATFTAEEDAVRFIGRLPGHEDGRYYLDPPEES